MDNKIKLSESEWKIMSVLWDNEPMTITQLTATLKDETGWGKSTIITFLKRMEDKGAVAYEQGKTAKSFYTLIKRENVAVSETKSFLKRLYNGSLGLMVNSLIQQEALSDEDISELYNILKKADENRKGEKND